MIAIPPFCICGDWDVAPTPVGLKRIILPPLGHIYGGGWHATTQSALVHLPEHITPKCSFVDIGTGSGILSVAAKLLGAGKCYATELDAEALKVAQRTFDLNHVDVKLVKGTFISETVDIAVISIATSFANDNLHKIRARKVLVVNDDATVTVYERGQV